MLSQHLHPDTNSGVPLSIDGDVYRVTTPSAGRDTANSWFLTGLPSLEHSLYLVDTVKFRLWPLFRLFDEVSLTASVRELYQYPDLHHHNKSLSVKILLVLAFGKAFVAQGRASGTPPGEVLYSRAMALIPSVKLWEDPLLAVENFGLIALYLYSIDKKESAYLYVSLRCDMDPLASCIN